MDSGIKPTVYLIKSDTTSPSDIFKDVSSLDVKTSGNISLFYKDSPIHPPKWAGFVSDNFSVDSRRFKNASAYAAIVVRESGRFFVIPMGMGLHLIDMSIIEYNFGLKVALNCIPKDEIRQMDLTTPEANSQKTKKQAVKSSTAEEFGVSKQKDILRGVVGKLNENHEFGDKIEGKDSVRISKTITRMDTLTELCRRLLAFSDSKTYQRHFPWIDNMAVVSDPKLVERLDQDMLEALKAARTDDFTISAPEFVDNLYEFEGFVFTGNRKRLSTKEAFPFPNIKNLLDDIGEADLALLDRTAIHKSYKVRLRDADGAYQFNWPIYRCIGWETEREDSKFILSEGTWYKIENNFYHEVQTYFADRVQAELYLPPVPEDNKRESDYNAFACRQNPSYYLFDLGHSSARMKHFGGNEFCDIFDASRNRFIHIKPGKHSPDISHLLRQGAFSGTSLKLETKIAEQFRAHLNDYNCPTSAVPTPFSPSQFKIVFVVILASNQTRDIPFFSKVSFMDTSKLTLEILGYSCQFGYLVKNVGSSGII